MATVSPPTDQAADLLQKLSLDSQTKTIEIPDPTKKPSIGSAETANGQVQSCERSMTTLSQDFMDPTLCFLPSGYPSTAYYYGSYEGTTNDWDEYARYANPEGVEMPPGVYGDNRSIIYHHGYGYAPYAPPSPAGSPVPTMGHDGQLYGAQHYQYPTPYFQPLTPTSAPYNPNPAVPPKGEIPTCAAVEQAPLSMGSANGNTNGIANGGVVKGNNGSGLTKQTHQNSRFISNGSYGRGTLPGGIPASSFQDPRFGFDGLRSPIPWLDGSIFSDGQPRPLTSTSMVSSISHANNASATRSQNFRPHSHLMRYLQEIKRQYAVFLAMAGEQLQVLNALDVAKKQWCHFTAVIVAGMGFFTDAYDLFCISLVTKLLGRVYYHGDGSPKPGSLPPNVSAAVNGVAFCGTLAGQLFFGWLGDKLGRKRVYGLTLMLMCICSIASGLSFGKNPKAVMATLCFFRFWLGFGIGGDYALSAIIMSEYANKKTRGAFIAAVFAMQGFGILVGGIFAIIILAAYDAIFNAPAYAVDPVGSTVSQADFVWRIILIVGALPALLTYYWRMKMPETARYTALIANDAKKSALDMGKVLVQDIEAKQEKAGQVPQNPSGSFGLSSKEFLRCHGLHLFGTTSTWFLLDIAFYSQNLFQKDIFSTIGWIPPAKIMNAIQEVYKIAGAQTLISLCSTVPGYWFTVVFIDKMGRSAIQLMGFFMMTVFMFALAIPYNHWTHPGNHIGFVVLSSLTFFFTNFGPNATTFVVPAEIFPARFRSTCHGISAASGKLGAIMGAFGFLYLAQNKDKAEADAEYPAGIGVKNSLLISDMGKVLWKYIKAKQKKAGQLNFMATKLVMILIVVAILSTTTTPLVAGGPLVGRKLSVGGGGGRSESVPRSKDTPVRLPSPSSCTYVPGLHGSKPGSHC